MIEKITMTMTASFCCDGCGLNASKNIGDDDVYHVSDNKVGPGSYSEWDISSGIQAALMDLPDNWEESGGRVYCQDCSGADKG